MLDSWTVCRLNEIAHSTANSVNNNINLKWTRTFVEFAFNILVSITCQQNLIASNGQYKTHENSNHSNRVPKSSVELREQSVKVFNKMTVPYTNYTLGKLF